MSEFDRDYETDEINSDPNIMWAFQALKWKAEYNVHETVDLGGGGSFIEGLISHAKLDSQAYPLTLATTPINVLIASTNSTYPATIRVSKELSSPP